jgi:AcrR family transcriptional regulator
MTERFGHANVIAPIRPEIMTIQDLELPAAADLKGDKAKQRQIMEGACRVFLAHGFDAASMGAIAREAGVSKGTLYVYFKSKEELFESIVEEQCSQQAEQVFATLKDDADIETVLLRLGDGFVRFLCRPGGLSPLRTVLAIADRMPELGARFYQTGPARGVANLTRYLESQIAAGVLIPHDCEVTAAQLIDSCLSLTFKPMMFNTAGPPSDAHIARVVGSAVRTFLRAYRAQK